MFYKSEFDIVMALVRRRVWCECCKADGGSIMLYSTLFRKGKTLEFYIVNQYEDRDGCMNLTVRVEEAEDRSHFCEWRLPDVSCYKSYGFSEDDIFGIERYLRNNESIMWDDWRESCAKGA